MKKALVTVLTLATLAGLTGCTRTPEPEPPATVTKYITRARYTAPQLTTADGNLWSYDGAVQGENIPEHHQTNTPVYAVFHDNGTPDELTDDVVCGLVFDRETAIYDDLYQTFSNDPYFTVDREGNTLHIGTAD